jgi:hypothetical protein
VRFPQAVSWFPCFKTDTQVYLVIKETLYSFTPQKVKPITRLPGGSNRCSTSYYSRGTLYYSWSGEVKSLEVGQLMSSRISS